MFIQPELDLLHLKHYYLWLPGKIDAWPLSVQSRPPSLRFTEVFTTSTYHGGGHVRRHVATCLAENDCPSMTFYCLVGNEQTRSGPSLALLKKEEIVSGSHSEGPVCF